MQRAPKFSVDPRGICRVLGAIAASLLLAHFGSLILEHGLGYDYLWGAVPFFDLDHERSAGNFFSACLLLLNSVLFWIAWKLKSGTGEVSRPWALLSALFCFLAIDELSFIHERLTEPVRSVLDTSGLFYFAWIIPYGVGVAILSVWMLPVLRKIDPVIRKWFLLAAALYLGGAIGMEMLGGRHSEAVGETGVVWGLLTAAEESLEMAGLITLVYALLSLVGSTSDAFVVAITPVSAGSETPVFSRPASSAAHRW